MKPELKARLARLEQARDIDRVSSGSPVDLVLRRTDGLAQVRTIAGMEALVRRGVTVSRAKRTVETMVEHGEAYVHVPTVEDIDSLAREFRAAGITARRLANSPVDMKAVRASLGLTQEQFALRFGLDIDAVQNWEQGRCQPDRATASYLRAISQCPREIAEALEEELA